MSERVPAIKVLLLPKDTNALGTIFGGVILSHIDLASAVEARKHAARRYVTKAMREVEFHEPVFLGDVVNFFTETVRVGRTSITVRVSRGGGALGERPGREGEGDRGRGGAGRGGREGPADPDPGSRAGLSVHKVVCPHDCPDTCVMTVDGRGGPRGRRSAATPSTASPRASCAPR